MAAAARNTRYHGRQAVDGSLAHDLDWPREQETRHAEKSPKRQEKAKAHVAISRPRVQIRARQYVSRLTVLSVTAIMVLATVVLMNYVELTLISAETVKLQEQLSELETENVNLTARYQQMFDMASVKDAAESAGMGKPSSTQMDRLDLSGGDSAVAYRQKEPGLLSRILSSLHGGVYAVVEYFD